MRVITFMLLSLSFSASASSFWQNSSFFTEKEKTIFERVSKEDYIYQQQQGFLRESSEKRLAKLLEVATQEEKKLLKAMGLRQLSWPSVHKMLERKTDELMRY